MSQILAQQGLLWSLRAESLCKKSRTYCLLLYLQCQKWKPVGKYIITLSYEMSNSYKPIKNLKYTIKLMNGVIRAHIVMKHMAHPSSRNYSCLVT